MDWVMSLIIFGCNVLTVLICRYAYPIRNEYKDGMILWTHIPAYEAKNQEVQNLVLKSQSQWKNKYEKILKSSLKGQVCHLHRQGDQDR